jgi:predicted membrane protein
MKKIICFILALPFIIVFIIPFGFPVWFVIWCHDADILCFDTYNCCYKMIGAISFFILGVIINPFVIVFFFFAWPFFLYKKCKKMNEEKARRKR